MEDPPKLQGATSKSSANPQASTNKKPKGRFAGERGNRTNHRSQYLVINRTNEDKEEVESSVDQLTQPQGGARRKQFYSGYKRNDSSNRPKSHSASQGNWRARDERRPATAELKTKLHEDSQPVSPSTVPQLDDTMLVAAVSSSLNVEAKPFVPTFTHKPEPAKNMAKLGKVKKQRHRQFNPNVEGPGELKVVASSEQSAQKGNEDGKKEAKSTKDDKIPSKKSEQVNFPNRRQKASGESSIVNANDRSQKGEEMVSRPLKSGNSASSRPYSNRTKERDGDRYSLKQRQRDNKKQQQHIRAAEDKKKDSADCSHVADNKKPSRREQYAHLHDFSERKPTNVVKVESQRESMIETLTNATYECTICYVAINQQTSLWSCGKCYHMFHFYCIKKWANTLIAQNSGSTTWRCPTCQDQCSKVPNQYKCFCGKVRDPVWNTYETPHSCGEVCGTKRADNCTHPCTELCHPGPCPPCNAFTSKHCSCRRSYQKVKCCQQVNVHCTQTCNSKLNCGLHSCATVCHSGQCHPCDKTITQGCHCSDKTREVTCGSEKTHNPTYSCGKVCDKPLACGNHNCSQSCHTGDCSPCKTSLEVVTTCNCGKTQLSKLENVPVRVSCTDVIPACNETCEKKLNCGTQGALKSHICQLKCHVGDCLCQLTSQVTCVCGLKHTNMPCSEAMLYTDKKPYRCEKKCSKKRECGRHKCGQQCCTLPSHPCLQICGKKLTCGNHRCENLCHIGNCHTCYNVSFDELRCHCGIVVTYPPIPCGAPAPECHETCNRVHPCEHPISHNCHTDVDCPPCVALTNKLCLGKHEYRNYIPCYIKDVSCGKACGKPLPCGNHKCLQSCHKGDCGEEKCRQPCQKSRISCGHPCGSDCHGDSECPSTDCNSKVSLKCHCGNRKELVLCFMKEKKVSATFLTIKMKELNSAIDIAEMMASVENKELRCDESCAQVERNRRIASALDIVNPELLSELSAPQYSDFLKAMARRDPTFIADIERALYELVGSALQETRQRSHVFKPMKHDQRKAVHELAECYGCESVSYDEEPCRNVVTMAHRGKASLPPQTLTSFMKSEKHPRPPVPIPINADVNNLRMKAQVELQSTAVKPEENRIDYFEMT